MRHGPLGPVGRELVEVGNQVSVSLQLLGERGAHWLALDAPVDANTADWDLLSRDEQSTYAGNLNNIVELEEYIRPTHDWARVLSAGGFALFEQAVGSYHDALPFAPVERRWLVQEYEAMMYRREPDDPSPDSPDPDRVTVDTPAEIAALRTESDILMVGGRPRRVTGDELIQRWWSWRRGSDEFKDSQGYERAIQALNRLVTLVVVEPPPIFMDEVINGRS